jgi:hypothetical protein
MSAKSLFLFLSLCPWGIISPSIAQQPVFTKVYYDLNAGLHVYGADRSSDHGYVIVGQKYSEEGNSGHIMKIDSAGTIEWAKSMHGLVDAGLIQDVLCEPDSTTITVGNTRITSAVVLNIIKWDKNGVPVWITNIGDFGSLRYLRIRKSINGGYLISGTNIFHSNPFVYQALLVRIDQDGNLLWSKTYNSDRQKESGFALGELPDGHIIMAGASAKSNPYEENMMIIKTDQFGSVVSSHIVLDAGIPECEVIDLQVVPDGIVLFATFYGVSGLVKVDSGFNMVWARQYGFFNYSMWIDVKGRMSTTYDGGYILGSPSNYGTLFKTDDEGIPEWQQNSFMDLVEVVQANDSGYMAFGNGPVYGWKTVPEHIPHIGAYKSDEAGNSVNCVSPSFAQMEEIEVSFTDFTILASDLGSIIDYDLLINDFELITEDTCVVYTSGIEKRDRGSQLKIFPNPANGIFSFELPDKISHTFLRLEILGSDGQVVYVTNDPSCLNNGIDPGYLPEGIYLVRLVSGNSAYTGKLLINH